MTNDDFDQLKEMSESDESQETPADVSEATKPSDPARIITLFSLKGGVGKTFIATNLAVALSQDGSKIVIVDLDLHSGDVCTMLNLKPKRVVSDLADSIEFYTSTDIEKMLTPYTPQLKVMAAPLQPELAESITPDLVHQLLSLLRDICDYIIIDCPSYFNENVLAALSETDRFFLIATVDLLSLKSALLSLQTLQLLDFPETRIKFILNRSRSFVGLSDREVEKTLGIRIWGAVPLDRTVPTSINTGMPLITEFPRSPAAKSIFRLAAHTKHSLQSEIKSEHKEAA